MTIITLPPFAKQIFAYYKWFRTSADDTEPGQKSSDEDEVVGPYEGDTPTTEVRFVPADKGSCKSCNHDSLFWLTLKKTY